MKLTLPRIPTPTSAACIMLTSLPPSPDRHEIAKKYHQQKYDIPNKSHYIQITQKTWRTPLWPKWTIWLKTDSCWDIGTPFAQPVSHLKCIRALDSVPFTVSGLKMTAKLYPPRYKMNGKDKDGSFIALYGGEDVLNTHCSSLSMLKPI